MEQKPVINLMEDAEPEASETELQKVVTLSDEMLSIERELEALADKAKIKSERYQKIQMDLLPDLMSSLKLKKFTLSNGYFVEVGDFVRGTIPTTSQIEAADEFDRGALMNRREKALAWLKERGAESIIKNEVVALFGKGQDADAKKLFNKIQSEGFVVKCVEEINFQTLNSYLKEALREGKEVPAEPFALFSGRKATIKPPPKPKAGKKGEGQ